MSILGLRPWIGAIAVVLGLAGPLAAQSKEWIYVEARTLPTGCSDPLSCLDQARPILRNLMRITKDERATLLRVVNTISSIRGITDADIQPNDVMAMVPQLHKLPVADRLAPLVNHPGVYFDSSALDADPDLAGFSAFVRRELSAAGLTFLTKEQMEATPGRPTLTVRYSERRESAGCIIPYAISFAINEEYVMVRNPNLKKTTAIWSAATRENLAIAHFTAMDALKEGVEKLAADFRDANST
ncbi:hypothetical protein ACMU_09885 [Actibacterium mucosum KCTC 23349]|uniref:DUF302 domain-containing protein n=1 Tax=Actibacterium mucosum KCTC 23349 TaxID=1454373 RepID=A0A037ZK95_9RHOB|nr:hypothetical protein [Actibacterium mucosum]KAJ56059.1 hypothetical protein ACMU_09885 [Actibacterium mucosum KCTC 23349]